MPIPKPKDGETKDEFMERCMGDEVMNDEYPDNAQRYAVCLAQWEKDDDDSSTNSRNHREIRTYNLDSIAVRTAAEGGQGKTLEGHAAVFNQPSEDLGGFREIIEPGAFATAIRKDDIRALFNHDPNYILGRNKAKTLMLEEDKEGLRFSIDLPDTSYARDLAVSVGRGDISQCSFAFRIDGKNGERWEVDGKEAKLEEAFSAMWDKQKHEVIRHVVKARLFDVSPVTYPAYPQTDVSARALEFKDRKTKVEPASAGPAPEGWAEVELARRRFKYGLNRK